MSKKKKRNHRRSGGPSSRNDDIQLEYENSSSKRFNPKARNLLLADLVLLAIGLLGDRFGFLPPLVSLGITIIGLILLLMALYFQFGGGNSDSRPRLH